MQENQKFYTTHNLIFKKPLANITSDELKEAMWEHGIGIF
jgi:hypothetical protein